MKSRYKRNIFNGLKLVITSYYNENTRKYKIPKTRTNILLPMHSTLPMSL